MGKYDQYKESAFTHEEMQPMIIETDMTDIVEQLRSPANVFYEYAADNGAFLREAADEIERLRAALRKISNMGQTNVPDHWDFRVKAREIARAALVEKE